jgi:hypothetical protein
VKGVPVPLNERFSGRGMWVVGVAVGVTAAAVGLVLVLGGRLRPYRAYRNIFSRTLTATDKRRNIAATSSTESSIEPNLPGLSKETPFDLPGWINRFTYRRARHSAKALAYLVPLSDGNTSTRITPIALHKEETLLGCDPRQVTQAIPDPALDGAHSRLNFEEGKFRLFDLDTTAGTWVNFEPVPKTGVLLRHGDLVHIGRTTFRFTARDSKDARKPVIIPVEQTRDQA